MAQDSTKVLISLEEAKRYLNIGTADTAQDRLLDALVMHSSVLIRNELGCDVVAASYTKEVHSGSGGYYLALLNWPIQYIDRLSIGTDDALSISYDSTGTHATVGITSTGVRLRVASAGSWSTTEITFTDNATLSALATSITAETGWTATVESSSTYNNYPSTELIVTPALNANDVTLTFEVPEIPEDDYEIYDDVNGILYNPYGFDVGKRNIFVDYKAGYDRDKMPEGIQSACLELVALLYRLSKKDPTLKSETIGDYSYTTAVSLNKLFDTSSTGANLLAAKLAGYRRMLIAGV